LASFDMAGKDHKVEADVLVIEDNIMRWANTMIQISNIALISTVGVHGSPFPLLSLLPLGIGIYMISEESQPGWIFALVAVAWIVYWAVKKDNDSNKAILRISLNSGITYSILFNDKKFLREVMKQLANLISKPFSSRNLTINVKDSNFGGNSSLIRSINS